MSKKLILLLCLILMCSVVSAESLNGSFLYSANTNVVDDMSSATGAGMLNKLTILRIKNIEYTYGLQSWVLTNAYVPTYFIGSPVGDTTPVSFRSGSIGGPEVFTGVIGYQRSFNALGVEQPGYIWITVNSDYDTKILGLTGNKEYYMNMSSPQNLHGYNATTGAYALAGGYPFANGMFGIKWTNDASIAVLSGVGSQIKTYTFKNNYAATKPDGLGITGLITKTIDGTTYASKVSIYDGLTKALITADSGLVSTDFTFNTNAATIIIGVLNAAGLQTNTTALFASTPNFTLFVTETNLLQGGFTTGGLTSSSNDMQNIKAINYYRTQVGDSEPTYESTSFYESGSTDKTLNYVFRSPNWYGYNTTVNDYTNNKGTMRPEPVSLNFPNGGSYDVGAFVFTGVNLDLTDTPKTRVTVNSSVANAKATLQLFASDATTSQFISPVTYAVKNLVNNSWSNYTSSLPDGSAAFTFSKGVGVTVYISATGYQSTSFTTTVNGNNIITTPLTPTNLFIPASNLDYTNLQVTLKYTNDGIQYYPAKNIRVSAETFDPADPISKQYGDTNTEGVIFFTVLNQSQNHTQSYATVVTAVMVNYKTVSKSVIPTGNLYTVQLWTQANQIIIPTNQPTPIPLTISPTPTQTGIGGVIKNGTAAVCGTPNGSTNIVDIFKSNIACWGISDRFSQDLAFAALIILFCAFLMSKFGKGIGAIVGAAIGFVISLAANLIPIWVFFALVIIAGLIFGLKLYGSDK